MKKKQIAATVVALTVAAAAPAAQAHTYQQPTTGIYQVGLPIKSVWPTGIPFNCELSARDLRYKIADVEANRQMGCNEARAIAWRWQRDDWAGGLKLREYSGLWLLGSRPWIMHYRTIGVYIGRVYHPIVRVEAAGAHHKYVSFTAVR